MKLILPVNDSKVARASYPDGSKGLWHLMKSDKMAHCNRYFSDPRLLEEVDLSEADGDVCTICWPWGVEND